MGFVKRVAIGKHLRFCKNLPSLGVCLNWEDYDEEAKRAIKEADVVCYPSRLYEPFYFSIGKRIFPKNFYDFMGNKIRQTLLFEYLSIPHPRTRIYYGKNVFSKILSEFSYPFVAKNPLRSSQGRGVFLISSEEDLQAYLSKYSPAYIQEYLPVDRDLRVVLLAGRVIHAYWRIGKKGDFRNNVSQGATISYEDIPPQVFGFSEEVSRLCGFDDVGLDIIFYDNRFYVIEANMVYGLEGFRKAGKTLSYFIVKAEKEGWLIR